MIPLSMSSSLRQQIEAEGVAAYPNECCGILVGRDVIGPTGTVRIIERLYPVPNVYEASEQYHRFAADPLVQIRVEKEADAQGMLVLGFYHSHPDHPARPSETDRLAAWPFYSYVIVSILKGAPSDMTSWTLDEQTETFKPQEIEMNTAQSTYFNPDALVTTGWVAEHLNDPKVKIVEVDVEPAKGYEVGHIRGAIGWNWTTDLCDQTLRDLIDPRAFAELCRRAGINSDDTVILYGDMNNWFAAWALWQFKYHGHKDVRLMNGGRKKWELEKRELTDVPPQTKRSNYPVPSSDESIRAYRQEVLESLGQKRINLVDVRSPDEYTGKIIAPPGMSETAQRAGHIPGARSIPWSKTVNDDGTFKTADELRTLYTDAGVDLSKPTIAYCRIGERSSHTWFVLKNLLGVSDVKNYDGSWTEWGNLVGAPIEKGEVSAAPAPQRCE